MKRLLLLLILFSSAVLFAQQPGERPINIPIETPPELGYGATFTQDLGISPAQIQTSPCGYSWDGVYTLTFTVKNDDSLPKYPGWWEVEITFGTQKLCDDYGWGTRGFTQTIKSCPAPAYIVNAKSLPGGGPVQGSNNLVAKWMVNDGSANGGWPIKFYDASLTFTPVN